MNFDASGLVPVLSRTAGLFRSHGLRYAPPLILATAGGVIFDAMTQTNPAMLPPGNLAYAIISLFVAAWVTALALGQVGITIRSATLWRVSGLFMLSLFCGVAVIIGFIVLILPGFYLLGRWFVALPAMLAEGTAPSHAMERSWHMLEIEWLTGALLTLGVAIFRFLPFILSDPAILPAGEGFVQFTLLAGVNFASEFAYIFGLVAAVAFYERCGGGMGAIKEVFG